MPKRDPWPKNVLIEVKREDIEDGKCKDPNLCMIKVAVKRAIGGHGYVKVDSTGISITRRDDYREKFWWSSSRHKGLLALHAFDEGRPVKPFTFIADFHEIYQDREA